MDGAWTTKNLLPLLQADAGTDDYQSTWDGFLASGHLDPVVAEHLGDAIFNAIKLICDDFTDRHERLVECYTAILGCSGRNTIDSGFRVESVHGPVYVGLVPRERILDAAACFRVLDHAKQMNCTPIIWNHWERLPADSARLATLMMGRAIECCAPILISDSDRICELIELSNRNKIPARRVMESSGDAIVDIEYAWGLDNAFKIVTKCLPADMAGIALDRYRSLA